MAIIKVVNFGGEVPRVSPRALSVRPLHQTVLPRPGVPERRRWNWVGQPAPAVFRWDDARHP